MVHKNKINKGWRDPSLTLNKKKNFLGEKD